MNAIEELYLQNNFIKIFDLGDSRLNKLKILNLNNNLLDISLNFDDFITPVKFNSSNLLFVKLDN